MCTRKSPFYNAHGAWSPCQDSSICTLFWVSSPLPHLALLQLFFTWDFLHLLHKVAPRCARENCQLSIKVVKLAEPDSRKMWFASSSSSDSWISDTVFGIKQSWLWRQVVWLSHWPVDPHLKGPRFLQVCICDEETNHSSFSEASIKNVPYFQAALRRFDMNTLKSVVATNFGSHL